jgi:hypothetical protein
LICNYPFSIEELAGSITEHTVLPEPFKIGLTDLDPPSKSSPKETNHSLVSSDSLTFFFFTGADEILDIAESSGRTSHAFVHQNFFPNGKPKPLK